MILIDTHVRVWWVTQHLRLPARHAAALSANAGQVGIADVSLLEVAMLIDRERLVVSLPAKDWLDRALTPPTVQVFPITPQIASEAVALPNHHKDPFDRLILATAKTHRIPLLTEDAVMHRYDTDVRLI